MPAADLDTAGPRPLAAVVLQLADELSIQASCARWLRGLAEDVHASRTEEGTSQ